MKTKSALTTEAYPVGLDPTVSIEEQVRQGNYGYANPSINSENFTLTLTGKRDVILVDPKGFGSSETIIARLKAEGCVPATLDDALAIGIKYPDRQKTNPIVFFGTIFPDPIEYGMVPVLGDWYGLRGLLLCSFDGGWRGHYRFAAVRQDAALD